ncbi:MAG: FprA family A-type flavoprotein [Candidatus Izemoplasmatales bacterium]|jgi:flavorubredoxin|nr:FprA family A-type flavoprotein [Candidatus Izemoplasmatales bacterium]
MQTNTFKITEDIIWVGVNDETLRVFDITMFTPFGSTYNAYLVLGSEKNAIIDTAKANYTDDFIAKIETIIDFKKIDYLIVNHTEPDHSGSVVKVIEKNPEIMVVASAPALSNLKEIVNAPFNSTRAKDDLKISLGNKTLSFSIQPNLHWPDTMFTYIEEDKALFTCDFFGAHYSLHGVLAKNITDRRQYIHEMKYYFECIMSPFKKDAQRALKFIDTIQVKYICTSHGAVIDETFLDEAKLLYKDWSTIEKASERPLVIIPYTSVYGYTRKMVPSVVEGLKLAFSDEIDIEVYDLVETPLETVLERIKRADGFLLGSTTILGDAVKPAWDVLISMNPHIEGGKFASVFGSYGWSGEGVKFLQERLLQLKMKAFDSLRIRFNPSVNQLEEVKDYGYKFGLFMQGKQ